MITTYQNPSTALDRRSSASILFSRVEQRVCRSWSGCPERDPPLHFCQNVSTAPGRVMPKVFPAQNMPYGGHERSLPNNVLAQPFHQYLTTYLQSEYQRRLCPHAASPSLFLCAHQETSSQAVLIHTTYQIVTAEEIVPTSFDAPALATIVHHRTT